LQRYLHCLNFPKKTNRPADNRDRSKGDTMGH
jgi:hypothetical protein